MMGNKQDQATFSVNWDFRHKELGCYSCRRAIIKNLGVESCCPIEWSMKANDEAGVGTSCPINRPTLDLQARIEELEVQAADLQKALDDKLLNSVCRELSLLAGKKRWSAAQGMVYKKLAKLFERYMSPETDRIESRNNIIKRRDIDIKALQARIDAAVETAERAIQRIENCTGLSITYNRAFILEEAVLKICKILKPTPERKVDDA